MKKCTLSFFVFILSALLVSSLIACDDTNNSTLSKFSYLSYENIASVSDVEQYHSEVLKDSKSNNDPTENGVIKCPYYTLKINGIDVPVYSTRCANSVHSFAWIDVNADETEIILDVELNLNKTHKSVVVLPEKSGVKPNMDGKKVTAQIKSLGSFSFAFDRKVEEALTIYVAKTEKNETPAEYTKVEFQPGKYSTSDTDFKNENTMYYFNKGTYEITSISLPSNSVLYFEPGTYVKVYSESDTDRNGAIRSSHSENVKIYGRALFDFSSIQGGDEKTKAVFSFKDVSDSRFSGITAINSNSWTVCFTDSDNILVENNMLLGYRTYSDGIMMSDCQDSLIRNNFVRTGDDAVEVKSTGSEGTENMLFEHNAVWTDKAIAYGCVYESNNTVKNVVFRNNSVGFALGTWTDRLGCCIVFMGDRKTTQWQDIHFENIEIYISYHALINITLKDEFNVGSGGGKAKDIYFENIKAYRSFGNTIRICVESGSTLGKVYLDNIYYNDLRLTESDITSSELISIKHYSSSWSPTANIKVNTLVGE